MTMTTQGWATSIYFVLIVLIGSFYVLNLFLAVLWETYDRQESDEATEETGDAGEGSAEEEGKPLLARDGDAAAARGEQSPLQLQCRGLIESSWFEQLSVGMVIVPPARFEHAIS
jgi:hypothetical protein